MAEPIEMKVVNRKEIIVGQRFREDYGNIQELATSLREEGIIQPLAVKANEDGTYTLLAGGRRMKAIEVAGITDVPVRIFPCTISDIQMRVIELMENVCRQDMTWLESTRLKKEIHDLQIQIHGKKVSTSPTASGWSQRDTARLLGVDHTDVGREIELAKAVELFPALKEAKTKAEANKMLAKLKEGVIREEMSKRIQAQQTSQPADKLKLDLISRYVVSDFLTMVKQLPDKCMSFCEVDPPYAIDLMDVKRADGESQYTEGCYNEIKQSVYLDFMRQVLTECYRVMENDSWLVLWFAQEPWFEPLYCLLCEAGFETRRIPALWDKGDGGQTMQPEVYLGNCYEPFFYARKGKPQIVKQGRSNIFRHKPVASAKKLHPTERPVSLIQDIMQTFCNPGTRVLVPFLGSGATLLAAANMGFTAIGSDLSKEYKDAFSIRVYADEYGKF